MDPQLACDEAMDDLIGRKRSSCIRDTFNDQPVAFGIPRGELLRVQIEWDSPAEAETAGLDCSAVAFDRFGGILDGVHANCSRAFDACLGYEVELPTSSGGGTDDAETSRSFYADLALLPEHVHVILFLCSGRVASCFRGTNFINVSLLSCSKVQVDEPVEDQGKNQTLHKCRVDVEFISVHTSVIVAGIFRTEYSWAFRRLVTPTMAFTFYDAIEDMSQCVASLLNIEAAVPGKLVSGDTVFNMSKGDVALLPEDVRAVTVGLGWNAKGNLDLDASAVLLGDYRPDRGAELLDTVWYYQKKCRLHPDFVVHSGDREVGQGVGDDESINVRLRVAPPQVKSIVFVVNCYGGGTFKDCYRSYIALRGAKKEDTSDGKILASFKIDSHCSTPGIIFARLFRYEEKWAFQSLGVGCNGQTVMSIETMEVLTGRKPGIHLDLSDNATDGGICSNRDCCVLQ